MTERNNDGFQQCVGIVAGIYASVEKLLATPDGTTQRELEDKWLDVDMYVNLMAPDGPKELYDEWSRLRKLMTPEFRRQRDQRHGVVNDDY